MQIITSTYDPYAITGVLQLTQVHMKLRAHRCVMNDHHKLIVKGLKNYDHLSAHKNKEVKSMIESVGAQLWFLPPYSPDLNSIEKMWSKIKSISRTLKARTEKALINAIAKALEAVTASDAKGRFESCGYQYTKT